VVVVIVVVVVESVPVVDVASDFGVSSVGFLTTDSDDSSVFFVESNHKRFS